MRIQHNIMAMNAYRNYNNNTGALSKNLEKLSSGYKINRAGDDAAGLAISEKMRAQITGLDAAQKNVKDGISLVKTAEGAMQEIQDMLNRMDYLATQSANGTYQNEVDRENLQKEVNNLKSEINRIADSSNFNGIKLLDGSLDSGSSKPASSLLKTFAKDSEGKWLEPTEIAASKGSYTTSAFTGVSVTMSAGDTIDVSFEFQNADGSTFTKEIHLTVETTSTANQFNLVDENGNKMNSTALSGKLTHTQIAAAVEKALKQDDSLTKTFTIAQASNGIKFDANAPGKGTQLVGVNASTTSEKAKVTGADGATTAGWVDQEMKISASATSIVGEDKTYAFNLASVTVWDGTEKNLADSIMELDGHKFLFVQPEATASLSAAQIDVMSKAGVESWVQLATGTQATATEAKALVQEMRTNTGLDIVQCDNAGKADESGTYFRILDDKSGKGLNGTGGLTLQIGDTSDKFNQMKVSVGDMHTKAMGTGTTTIDGQTIKVNKTIADIDIGTQEGAQEAVAVIKNAINYVSSIRGDLGAVQNRLEHTQNNLGVMAENIQDAESTIRDTDVANEMMSYVKNNILVQSAQAMLAQANQVPQGVLQLLG